MTGLLLALFLYLLLKYMQPGPRISGCRHCPDLVHYDRRLGCFVHSNGREEGEDYPPDDPIDTDGLPPEIAAELTQRVIHLAAPNTQ